jgi:hypothetical protein
MKSSNPAATLFSAVGKRKSQSLEFEDVDAVDINTSSTSLPITTKEEKVGYPEFFTTY